MPILCLLFAVAYSRLAAAWQRRFANGLVALSATVHLVGVFGYSGYVEWNARHSQRDQGRSLFQVRDTQVEAHARAFARKLAELVESSPQTNE
jgi:hypothetical protein